MKFYEKAVFITSPQMQNDYYKLTSNDSGKILNTRDNDIPKTDGLLTVMKRFDTDGKIVFELTAGEYTLK